MDINLDKVMAEAEPGTAFTFIFDGVTYELPPDMDVRAIAAMSGGRLDDGLRMLLGPEQWQRIQDSPKVLTTAALEKLFDSYAEHSGANGVGESSASIRSSKSRAKR